MTRVLVVFASRNGSTQQVAEAVSTVALAEGADVRLVEAASFAEPVAGFDLVILGAPIYSGRWHPDARRFLRRQQRELSRVPVAVFALGPRSDEEEAWRRSWAQLHRALDKRRWLVPVAVGLFGGTDPARRGHPGHRDLRDWAEIGQWARKVLAQGAAREDG